MKKIIIVLLCLPLLAIAQDFDKFGVDTTYVPVGLNVGDKAPAIVMKTINKELFNSNEVLKNKEIVLVFYRGEWCPYCTKFLSSVNDSLKLIENKGAIVVAIGPESIDNLYKTKKKTKADFILISDSKMKVMKAFDVLFTVNKRYDKMIKRVLFTSISKNNGQEKAQLPIPATYVIGKDGKIKYKQFDYDYKNRATVKDVLKVL